MNYGITLCTVRGKSHINDDLPCQDRVYSLKNKNYFGISLADGAGAYNISQIGANLVTKEILHLLEKHFDKLYFYNENVSGKIIYNILRRNLEEKSKKLNKPIEFLSSTLLFAFIKNNKYIVGHIGDGVIGALKNNDIIVMSKPENGEFANVTYFLTTSEREHLRIKKGNMDGIEGFILMSDGSSSSLYSKKDNKLSNGAKKFILWTKEHSKTIVEKSIRNIMEKSFGEKTDDDCSVAILAKKAEK